MPATQPLEILLASVPLDAFSSGSKTGSTLPTQANRLEDQTVHVCFWVSSAKHLQIQTKKATSYSIKDYFCTSSLWHPSPWCLTLITLIELIVVKEIEHGSSWLKYKKQTETKKNICGNVETAKHWTVWGCIAIQKHVMLFILVIPQKLTLLPISSNVSGLFRALRQ